jgi:DNA polymerase-1
MEDVVTEARTTGYVTTLYGRRRAVADIRSTNHNLRAGAERVARNTPIQGTAADILKRAMIDVHRAMQDAELKSRMLLTVHDELLFEVPPSSRRSSSRPSRSLRPRSCSLGRCACSRATRDAR